MPKRGQPFDLILGLGQQPALVVGRGGRPPQALIRIGEARVFLGLEVSLVLRRFPRFLLAEFPLS